MNKIKILEQNTINGVRWSIVNWDDYVEYLERNGVLIPEKSYGITASNENKAAYEKIHGKLEQQILFVFHLKSKDDYEIITPEMLQSQREKEGKNLSKEIVIAWFETVINPLLEYLEVEKNYLSKNYWTWRFNTSEFELIRYISDYIRATYYPNYEQFCQMNNRIENLITLHDKGVKNLMSACSNMQKALESNKTMGEIYSKIISTEDASTLFKDYPERDRINLLSQYIINNVDQLSEQYLTAGFWNKYKQHFLYLQKESSIQPFYSKILDTGKNLLDTTGNLITQLRDKRNDLSLLYGVPPAPLKSPQKASNEEIF